MPRELRPAAPTAQVTGAQVDGSLLALVSHWRLVVAEVAEVYGLDLHDPAVLARPWPGVRTMIFALLERPGGWLRAALTKEAP